MIESLFITCVAIGTLFIIATIEKIGTVKGIIYSGISLIYWLTNWLNSNYIVVPSDTNYMETGYSSISFGMVMITVILLFVSILIYNFNKKNAYEEDRLFQAIDRKKKYY